MYCPKCGQENPDDAQVCHSCGSELPKVDAATQKITPRISKLATAALALGILSLFTFGLTIVPAIVLGIISILTIEKSGGRLTGRAFAILGIVIPVLVFLAIFVVLMPALFRVKSTAYRMVCSTNLSGIGQAMLAYANDYDGEFPRSAGKNGQWAMVIPNWMAPNQFGAYGLAADGSGGQGSITSCFYLLVKYVEVTPQSFICKGDVGTSVFKPAHDGAGNKELSDLWDFGMNAREHCSYSYHQPFSLYPLTTSSEPSLAVAADCNPWIISPAYEAKDISLFNPMGSRGAVRTGNAITHQEDGQNVLFMDTHVGFEKVPYCGINDDNIYTFWDGGDIRRGSPPTLGSAPMDRTDSLLVHDGY
jgi:hypothetical protein